MPNEVTCSKETRELIIECCVGMSASLLDNVPRSCILLAEFIHLISSEANEVCEKEGRKTIAPEHIITALKVKIRCSLCCYSF